jgi:hypothetical protein
LLLEVGVEITVPVEPREQVTVHRVVAAPERKELHFRISSELTQIPVVEAEVEVHPPPR